MRSQLRWYQGGTPTKILQLIERRGPATYVYKGHTGPIGQIAKASVLAQRTRIPRLSANRGGCYDTADISLRINSQKMFWI